MKINDHKLAIFLASLVLIFVYLYYVAVHPITLYNGDDWKYFGSFVSRPIPSIGAWNVTRLLPENLMPLIGYFSAFFINPLVGDYLVAASITLAIVIAIFLSLLYFAIYGLFCSLNENKSVNAVISIMLMLICFALFKGSEGNNAHMFYAGDYNLYFFYVFPNVLNSIIVLFLMKQLELKNGITAASSSGMLFAGIYFCIFSMLFSAGIIFAFSISVMISRFFIAFRGAGKFFGRLKRFASDYVGNYLVSLIIILGTFIAMVLEINSKRSKSAQFTDTYFGSIFSIEFLKRMGASASNFFLHIRLMNNYVLLILTLIVFAAFAICLKKKAKPDPIINLAVQCFLSGVVLFLFYLVIGAKSGPSYIEQIRCVYGVFFFVVIFVGLSAIYVIKEMKHFIKCIPLVLILLVLVVANSSKPYNRVYELREEPLIAIFIEADKMGHTTIDLYGPYDIRVDVSEYHEGKYTWALDDITIALYNHRITKNRIRIGDYIVSSEDYVYYVPCVNAAASR